MPEPTIGDLILVGDEIYDGPITGIVIERMGLDWADPTHIELVLDDGRRVCLDRETEYMVARRTWMAEGEEESW